MVDPNARFLIRLKKLAEQPAGYRVAHIHISTLIAAKKSRDNISRAITVLTEMRSKHKDGEIFLMKNLDIVFIVHDISKHLLQAACESIQQIFVGQAVLSFTNIHGGYGEFFTIFELGYEYPKLLAWAEEIAGVASASPAQPAAECKEMVAFSQLSHIKEELARIDISPMLFNQTVYQVNPNGDASPQFREMYMSVQVLEEMFCPGMSLTSNRWLFADLTADLDAAVLRYLTEVPERGPRRRISINVNLSSLTSDTFTKFDTDLPVEQRQRVIFEINKTDFFENARLFHELTPALRERGYKMLLDGLSFLNILAIDLDGLDCDYAKLFWSSEVESLSEPQLRAILDKIGGCQKPRFVLARCDAADSIRLAKRAGIDLVQGRLVDYMVRKAVPL